jgi:O-antigen ligase
VFSFHGLFGSSTPVVDLGQRAGQGTTDGGAMETARQEVAVDFRMSVFGDAVKLIRDFPVTGVGLGSFAGAFSQYRDRSATEAVALHPESDWLMFAAEAGLPALFCAAGLILLVFWRDRRRATSRSGL